MQAVQLLPAPFVLHAELQISFSSLAASRHPHKYLNATLHPKASRVVCLSRYGACLDMHRLYLKLYHTAFRISLPHLRIVYSFASVLSTDTVLVSQESDTVWRPTAPGL